MQHSRDSRSKTLKYLFCELMEQESSGQGERLPHKDKRNATQWRKGDTYRKTMSNLEEVKSRGANVLAIGSEDDESLKAKANDVIAINPEVKEIIAPLVYIVPLQLIAYYITLEKGHDPDKPKNLAKCVTVE